MSGDTNFVREGSSVRLPYNIREKKHRKVAYRARINPRLADDTFVKIKEIVIAKKKFLDPDFTAKQLAEQLNINTRYLSAVINSKFKKNYSSLINELRVKEAITAMSRKKNDDKNIDEIGKMVGFSNRQSFYAAFYRFIGITPRNYRVKLRMKA